MISESWCKVEKGAASLDSNPTPPPGPKFLRPAATTGCASGSRFESSVLHLGLDALERAPPAQPKIGLALGDAPRHIDAKAVHIKFSHPVAERFKHPLLNLWVRIVKIRQMRPVEIVGSDAGSDFRWQKIDINPSANQNFLLFLWALDNRFSLYAQNQLCGWVIDRFYSVRFDSTA